MEELTTKKTFRHYLYFMFGQQFSLLGSGIVGFVIAWWITIETQSAVFLSIAVFLIFLPQVIVTPFAGVLADRMNRKTILFMVDSLQAVLTFVLFLFFFIGYINIWVIFVIHTLRSVLFAFHVPAFQAIIPSMVPKERLTQINGLNFLISGVVFIIGPLLSAILLELFPITFIFLIDVLTFVMALIPLLLITIPQENKSLEESESEKKSFTREFKEGFLVVKAVPGLLSMIVFAMIFNFINRPFSVLWPYFINITHGGTALNLALLFVSMQIGRLLGSLITSIKKEWKHKIKINIVGATIFFAAYLLISLAPYQSFNLMMIGGFFGAIIFPITVATYLTILQTVVPSDKIGRVMSIDHMISMAIAPIGALMAGPMADLMGINTLFVICAFLGMIYPVFLWIFTKIRYLDYPREKEEIVVPKQEIIELKAQDA